MRAVWITRSGGPEALEVRDTADPEPGPGQVRIRVRAAGLGFAEVMAAQHDVLRAEGRGRNLRVRLMSHPRITSTMTGEDPGYMVDRVCPDALDPTT